MHSNGTFIPFLPQALTFLPHGAGHALSITEPCSYFSLRGLGAGGGGEQEVKVGFFVSMWKKRQKEGISVSFLFQVNSMTSKHGRF